MRSLSPRSRLCNAIAPISSRRTRRILFLLFLLAATVVYFSLGSSKNSPLTCARTSRSSSSRAAFDNVIVTLTTDDFVPIVADLIRLVRCVGLYEGPIVVLYTGMRAKIEPTFTEFNVILQDALELFPTNMRHAPSPPCGIDGDEDRTKRVTRSFAYYLKLSIFSSYFKQWNRVLWLDARNQIHYTLAPFFKDINSTGVLLANPDAWPRPSNLWPTRSQFFSDCNPKLFNQLNKRYDLDREHFQSTLMLFDTSIIDDTNTLINLAKLYQDFGVINSGDQGILSLHFSQDRQVYQHLPYRLSNTLMVPYDFKPRIKGARYIVTAWRDEPSLLWWWLL
jgi:hypothetical protein